MQSLSALWPLVARTDELDVATRALRDGHLVLAGAAGVGKSRLGREVIHHAASEGWHVEWAAASRASGAVPLAAVAPFLPPFAAQSHDVLFRATLDHLQGRASGKPLLVCVDDAHQLDDASAALLHLLATSGQARVAVTVTTGEPTPEAVTSLWKDLGGLRIELQPLSRDELEELLRLVLVGPIDGQVRTRLWELSRGNVLYLRELVIAAVESGALGRADDMWSWTRPFAVEPRLQEVIALRLQGLSEAERHALELIAHGEPIELSLVEAMASTEALASLEQRGLITVRSERQLALQVAHPLHGEAIRSSTPRLRARAILRQLADALAALGEAGHDDVLRLATWRHLSGDPPEVALVSAAAQRAWELGQVPVAERFSRLALEAGAGTAMALLLSQTLLRQGRPVEAQIVLGAQFDNTEDAGERSMLAAVRALMLSWSMGRPDEADQVIDAAFSEQIPAPFDTNLVALRGIIGLYRGQLDVVESSAVEVLLREATPFARCQAMIIFAPFLALSGRYHELDNLLSEHLDTIRGAAKAVPHLVWRVLTAQANALRFSGRVGEAIELAQRERLLTVDSGDDAALLQWSLALGGALLWAGRLAEALDVLHEASVLVRRVDIAFRDCAHADLISALCLAGEKPDPLPAAAFTPVLFESESLRGRAALHQAHGGGAEAVTLLLEALDLAEGRDHPTYAMLAAHDLVRFGAAAQARAALRRLAGRCAGELVQLFAAQADAVADNDGDALERTAARFDALGYGLQATETWAQAALAHLRRERGPAAATCAATAQAMAARLGGLRSPVLDRLAEQLVVPQLTDREREVAALAVRGLADRDIAAALFISVRTVNAHLRSVYAKLGLSGRAELADVLQATRPTGSG